MHSQTCAGNRELTRTANTDLHLLPLELKASGRPPMITYRSRFLKRGESWFAENPCDVEVDWILYHQCSRPVRGTHVKVIYTYAINLTDSQEQLLANLDRDTAYKVRRARERDKISCGTCDPLDRAIMDQFERDYNRFAALKGLAPLQRQRFESLAAAGLLEFTIARDVEGNPLVLHANYRDDQRASGLELLAFYRGLADSAARSLVGRANRYLTWNDFLRYKNQGLKLFDLGGWYCGTEPGLVRTNEFKKGFGGRVLHEYDCERIVTVKGRVVLIAAAALKCVLPGPWLAARL